MRHLADGRGRSPIDYFDVARLQFDGRAIAFHAAAVDGLATAFEKVRQAVAETRRDTGDYREQPRTIAFDEVGLVFDALDGARDHWSFVLVARLLLFSLIQWKILVRSQLSLMFRF